MEELAGLRDTLRAEEQTQFEVVEERERLTKQLAEMDATLQVLAMSLSISSFALREAKCVLGG